MDGENNGSKPYEQMGWFGGETPLFLETPIFLLKLASFIVSRSPGYSEAFLLNFMNGTKNDLFW